ncbi:hypothetical protein SBRCBS47491_006690 [Sporothrix bragantina]|uniref:Atos-like C-terminal domain-containing protein n=1 Tax=Sporothrix bragantina TaxID=671064 RepID=A0ABP0C9C2_9PEZI
MPMFEDTMELAQSGELPPKEPSPPPPRPSSPVERASTPSKPISIPTSPYHSRRMSEESIRTELCEGPLSTSPSPLPRSFTSRPSPAAPTQNNTAIRPPPQTPPSWDNCGQVTDRAELIERIKRGESPTWVPNRHLGAVYQSRTPTPSSRPPSAGTPTTASALLPPADITPERIPLEAHDHDAEASARLEDGMNIERPRSALHSGDFTQGTSSSGSTRRQGRLSDETEVRNVRAPLPTTTAPDLITSQWVATSPPRHYTPFSFDYRSPPTSSLAEFGVFRSSGPSPSSSISSSFVYKPPTSPLVQSQSNNDEEDTSNGAGSMNNIDIALGGSPTNRAGNMRPGSRRHTLAFPHHRHSQSSPYSATEPGKSNAGNTDDAKEPAGDKTPSEEDTAMQDVHVERLDLSETEARTSTTSASRSHKRRQHGPKAPPGGSYRIPEQGQLQIIIKNQNKTAVKLFLIPYDLTDMEPGTKTFIRQRSYSAGPIIDNLPTTSETSSDRPILRYLIHLHICCPSRGRYYLYKSIRVVFANRVPDGKEKLRNEITFPEPLYSPYKPVRVMHPTPTLPGGSGPGATLAAEKAYRRRSSGFSFSHAMPQGFDPFGIQHPPVPAVPPVSNLPKSTSATSSRSWSNQEAAASPILGQASSNILIDSRDLGFAIPKKTDTDRIEPARKNGESTGSGSTNTIVIPSSVLPLYKKLSKGDIGYGGNAFYSGSPAACEGLLSQRLRSLEVEKPPSLKDTTKETPDV